MNKIDMNTWKYRRRHRRCRYCKYLKSRYYNFMNGARELHKCTLKDKNIDIYMPLKGVLCSWYVVKDVIED